MRKLAWGAKVSPEFRNGVYQIVTDFGWTDDHADNLMSCMAFESAETFSPKIKNAAGSGAVGLIQFMPPTAVGLGTTTAALAAMSAIDQLRYVQKYFQPYYPRIHTLADMYMAILMPKYIGKPGNEILFRDGTTAYRQNSGLDRNNDGKITKDEASAKVLQKLEKGLRPENMA